MRGSLSLANLRLQARRGTLPASQWDYSPECLVGPDPDLRREMGNPHASLCQAALDLNPEAQFALFLSSKEGEHQQLSNWQVLTIWPSLP